MKTESKEDLMYIAKYADVSSYYRAYGAVRNLSALEVQFERDRMKPFALDLARMLAYDKSMPEIEEAYDNMTNKLVKNKMHEEQLKTAVRTKYKENLNVDSKLRGDQGRLL